LPPGTFETVQGVIALTSQGFLGAAQPGGHGTVDTLPEAGDGRRICGVRSGWVRRADGCRAAFFSNLHTADSSGKTATGENA
jgi:hypothetical protein